MSSSTSIEHEIETNHCQSKEMEHEIETSHCQSTEMEPEIETSHCQSTEIEPEIETSHCQPTEIEPEIETSHCTVSKTLDSLPDEMLLKIFSYLNVEDLCFSLTFVCERWQFLLTERTLWNCLNFICNKDMTTEHIIEVLTQVPLLRTIDLQWRTDTDILIDTLCQNCKEIRILNMVCCGKIKHSSVESLVNHYPLLEVFSLEKCWAVEESCYNTVYKFSHLKSLNLSHSKSLEGKMLRQIVSSCPHLVKINIDYVRGILDEDLLYLIEIRKNNLLSLILFGESLTDAAFCCLQKCRKLQTLHLTRCNLMTDLGLQSISTLLQLRSLKLRLGVNLSSNALANFLMKDTASRLEYLCLSRSKNFDDLAAYTIAQNCSNLRHLDVLYCPYLTEQGRESILKGCKKLTVLNFTDNALINDIIVAY